MWTVNFKPPPASPLATAASRTSCVQTPSRSGGSWKASTTVKVVPRHSADIRAEAPCNRFSQAAGVTLPVLVLPECVRE